MQRSPEMERFAHEMMAALEGGDLDALERMTSRDECGVSIGTDPSEYARGFAETMRLTRESTPEAGMRIHAYLDEVHAYQEGDVGWMDGVGRFEREGEAVEVRMTAVLHREDGDWRFVQSHASIGVPNEQMFDAH
jgi:SnoaL-like domain